MSLLPNETVLLNDVTSDNSLTCLVKVSTYSHNHDD